MGVYLLAAVSYLKSEAQPCSTYLPICQPFRQWQIAAPTKQMNTLLLLSKNLSSALPRIFIPAKYLRYMTSIILAAQNLLWHAYEL